MKNRTTKILSNTLVAGRLVLMTYIIVKAGFCGIIFSAAGMSTIVLLLAALMFLAFMDIYRTIMKTFNHESQIRY